MEIEIADLSGLPEGLKPIVQTVDGKSRLDLSKLMVAEDLTGLKTSLQAEREAARAYSKLGKPDELAAKIADLEAKAAKGGKVGEDAQAKIDALTASYEAKLQAESGKYVSAMKGRAIADLKSELAKAGVVPGLIDIMARGVMDRIQIGDDGQVKVVGPDGRVMLGSGPNHDATLADLAKEFAAIPEIVRDPGVGGGGKPAGGAGNSAPKVMTREAWSKLPPIDQGEFFAGGGRLAGTD